MQDQTKVADTKDSSDPSAPSGNNLTKVLPLIQKDHSLAKTLLAKLSGTETEQPVNIPSEFDFLDNLNKPTWIDNVKKVQKNIMTPEVKKKEIVEKVKPVKPVNEQLQADKEKEEEYREYPFFITIKKIMYANGDLKAVRDDSIVTMHIFLNKVIETVFDKHTLAKYFEPEKKHEKHNDKSFRHKSSMLKKLLSKLYPQEYFKFFQFNKIAKNVERLDYDLEKTTEAVDESKLFNYESDNDSDDGLSFKLINCNIRDEEKANFNHQRMEKLNEEGYLDFVACRSTNFLTDGRDKFLSFIDFESKDLGFLAKNKTMVEFIAYILCRVVGNTIENIVRNENHGTLKPISESISPEKINAEADKHLNHLKFQAKKAIRDSLSIEEIAFRLYLKECRDSNHHHHHDSTFPGDPEPTKHRKGSVVKEEPERIFLEDDTTTPVQSTKKSAIKTDWKKLPVTIKKQWIDRVMAEKQFKGLLEKPEDEQFKWEDIDPVNSYAEYLINSLKGYKDKAQITDQVYHELFKSYQNNEAPHPHIELQKQSVDKVNENINQSNQSSVAKGELIGGKESMPKAVTGKKRRLESIFE